MSETPHSPLPWTVEFTHRNRVIIQTPKGASHVYCLFGEFVGPPDLERQTQSIACTISVEEAKANAAFVVRAVNSYAAMVEALESVQGCPQAAPWLSRLGAWDKIDAALKLAKGKSSACA